METALDKLADSSIDGQTGARDKKEKEPETPHSRAAMSMDDLLAEAEHYKGELQDEKYCCGSVIDQAIEVVEDLEIKVANFDPDSGKIAFKQGDILKALLAKLQKQSNKKRFGWKKWVKENIKFMGLRKVQSLIQLAERPDLFPYTFLGVHRLLKLLRITKDRIGEDRVRDFLREHGIVLIEGEELIFPRMKTKIDEAIATARARRNGANNGQGESQKFERHLEKAEAAVEVILEDTELLGQISREKVISLKGKLIQLETSLPA
jgi:hypothetical protein